MLLRVLEGRAAYLTLGALLSLEDNSDNGDGDGENGRGRGGLDEDETASAALAGLYRPSLEPSCSWI